MVLFRQPNIIITGTPGTGKSSHVAALKEALPELNVIDVNALTKEKKLYSGYDEERQSSIVDDERLLDEIEDDLDRGNQLIDWHVCDVFPEERIDLVVVLRTETNHLYDRLKARGYDQKKVEENIDAEIMEVILNDARESYEAEVIVDLPSNQVEDVQSNVERIVEWYNNFKAENPQGVSLVDYGAESSDSDDDQTAAQ